MTQRCGARELLDSYTTPYKIDAELLDSSNSVLASTTQYATSAPLR